MRKTRGDPLDAAPQVMKAFAIRHRVEQMILSKPEPGRPFRHALVPAEIELGQVGVDRRLQPVRQREGRRRLTCSPKRAGQDGTDRHIAQQIDDALRLRLSCRVQRGVDTASIALAVGCGLAMSDKVGVHGPARIRS
ncbi:MAG: hypothetical protein R3D84_09860 [Paracoccaceae bacterium]